jgi:hypothetical protein
VVVQGSRRKSLKFASLEQAQQSQALLLSEAQRSGGHRIGDVLAEYEQAMVQERGRLPQTATESCQRLRRFLPVDAQLGDITPALAQQIYLQETERSAGGGGDSSPDADAGQGVLFVWRSARLPTEQSLCGGAQARAAQGGQAAAYGG